MNEHMIISRVEPIKHIERKVRRYNKKYQTDRQSFDVLKQRVKGVQSNENKYCV